MNGCNGETIIAKALPSNLATVRGVACLLLVAYHVVGSSPGRGLRLPDTSDWHYAMTSLELMRMPIFTILSGLLYGVSRARLDSLPVFARKKARRIAIPLVVLTLLTWCLREMMGKPQFSLLEALFFSYEHFWFLQALLLIFAAVALMDSLWRPGAVALFLLSALAALFSAIQSVPGPFSVGPAFYLLPFFLFGLGVSQLPRGFLDRPIGWLCLILLICALVWQQAGLVGLVETSGKTGLVGFACGCAATSAALILLPKVAWLKAIGRYSYTIYLWHVLFLSTMRHALMAAGATNITLLFMFCLASGLGGPILLHLAARRHGWLSVPFLGLKPDRVAPSRPLAAQLQPCPDPAGASHTARR